MNNVKYIIKLFLANFLFYSGFLKLYRKLFFQNKSIVLMYHRVLTTNEHENSFSHDGIIVHVDSFQQQIKFLASHFKILSIAEFSQHINEKIPFGNYSCLITFDDGWHDNYQNASPVLKSNQAPAHIFLPIKYISNSDNFWQEKLSHYINHMNQHSDLFSAFLSQHNFTINTKMEPEIQKHLIRQQISPLKSCSPVEIQRLLNECEKLMETNDCLSPKNNFDTYLSWNDINELQKHSISFGSHAVSHHILTKLSKQQLEYELSESKNIIESKTGKTVNSIAYPNGNHDKMVCKVTKDSDYELGFTTNQGYATSESDPLSIPRINIHEDMTKSVPLFYCRILGIF